jgi:hypothetical protein
VARVVAFLGEAAHVRVDLDLERRRDHPAGA